jgi:hypothetical protein
MSRTRAALLVLPLLAGCGEELPTDIGGTLLPGGVRSFEVVLEPGAFLLADTSFSGYSRAADAQFAVLASAFEGVYHANTLGQFILPTVISVRDAAGTVRTDTTPDLFTGRLIVVFDTLRSAGPDPVTVAVYELDESYDPATTTWAFRSDTGDVRTPWRTPGGSVRGGRVTAGEWRPGTDSLVLPLDSARLAAWADTALRPPGVLLRSETPNSRLRAQRIVLQIDAKSDIAPDTTVVLNIEAAGRAFVFDPLPTPSAAGARVGGIPAWRTILALRPGLDTLRVPCPDRPATCTLALRDVEVSLAALIMTPSASPPGFAMEDSVQIGAREVLVMPTIPLARSPLGEAAGVMRRPVSASAVAGGAGTEPIQIPITTYIRALAADTVARRPEPWLALLSAGEARSTGFVSFEGLPRLRLILTMATELERR